MSLYSYLRRLVPFRVKNQIRKALVRLSEIREARSTSSRYAGTAYSQEGEDRILFSLFSLLNIKSGFYVDVGAHHPYKYSNTCLCHKQGWRGINIDASAEAIAVFRKMRPKDINVDVGVGEKSEMLRYYVFDEPALNTFDAKVAQNVVNNSPYRIIEERIVEVMPLSQILDIYLPKRQQIDLLTVDVEGKDLDVLKSNDWARYVPFCVLVEFHSGFDQKEGFSFDEVLASETTKYLQSKGYSVFAKTLNTIFFIFKKYLVQTDLKVFVYDIPAEYRSRPDELSIPSETFYAINDFFKNSIDTTDPTEADFFFVPLNLVQFQFRNEDPRKIISELRYLSKKKDHILVAAGDFSQRSKKNHFGVAYEETYDWIDDFILLALESTSDLLPNQDIGIIPFNTLVDNPYFNTNKRIYLYSFLGKIKHDLLPETHVRSQLAHLRKKPDAFIDDELDVVTRRKLEHHYSQAVKDDFELLARNSTFTLAPAGYGKWTYRFFHAIQWGSIPVLFSDDYAKPFGNRIPYDSFSVTLAEKDILNVDQVLRAISPREIDQYQENLRKNQTLFTRRAFFEMLVRELECLRG